MTPATNPRQTVFSPVHKDTHEAASVRWKDVQKAVGFFADVRSLEIRQDTKYQFWDGIIRQNFFLRGIKNGGSAECRMEFSNESAMNRMKYFVLAKRDPKSDVDVDNLKECFGYDEDPFGAKPIYSFLELASLHIWSGDPKDVGQYLGACADIKIKEPLVCFSVGAEILAVDAQTELPSVYIFGEGQSREYFSDYRQLYGASIPFTVTDDHGNAVHILSVLADNVPEYLFSADAYCGSGIHRPRFSKDPDLRLLPAPPANSPNDLYIEVELDKDGHVLQQYTNWGDKDFNFSRLFTSALIRSMNLTPPKGRCGPVASALRVSVDFAKGHIMIRGLPTYE